MKDKTLLERFLAGMEQRGRLSQREASAILEQAASLQIPHNARTPTWIDGLEMKLSVAASTETSEETFDFSKWMLGIFKIEVSLQFKRSGEGYLVINWETSTRNPHGWWLTFFRADVEQGEPICEIELGTDFKGESRLFVEDLSFDPALVPFRYLVHPQLP